MSLVVALRGWDEYCSRQETRDSADAESTVDYYQLKRQKRIVKRSV